MLHLFTVTDRFQIENLGCVLVPGLSTELGSPRLRIGVRIRLRTPDGREVDTAIRDLPEIRYAKMPQKITLPVLLRRTSPRMMCRSGRMCFCLRRSMRPLRNRTANHSIQRTGASRSAQLQIVVSGGWLPPLMLIVRRICPHETSDDRY